MGPKKDPAGTLTTFIIRTVDDEPQGSQRRAPRLNHRKSRTGCRLCRTRRVKCDEVQPVCGQCQRHKALCDYDRFKPVEMANPSRALRKSRRDLENRNAPSEEDSTSTYRTARHLLELRLFHHFATHTSQALPTSAESRLAEIWRDYVPQLALKHHTLLNVIYSLAAFHLMSIESPTRELMQAHRDYMNSGLKAHREDICNPHSSNMHAIWFTSCLVRSLVFAALQERDVDPYTPPREWLQLASTAAPTFVAFLECAKSDPDEEAIKAMTVFKDSTLAIDKHVAFTEANRKKFLFLLERAMPRDRFEAWNDAIKEAYEHALSYLGVIRLAIDTGESSKQISLRLIGFPAIMPLQFVDLVLDGQPRALVVLAHFFGLMAGYTSVWSIGDTPRREILGIQTIIPEGWQPLMAWPISVCNDTA